MTTIHITCKNGTFNVSNGRMTIDTRDAATVERVADAMSDGMPMGYIRGLLD